MTNWKDPPADSSKLWLNKSLEIQILLACNWSCVSCEQFSQFGSIAWIKRGTMTLAQIENFCREMQQANAYFGRVRLVGGEPTVHPKFAEIVQMLHGELVEKGHLGIIEVITNGTHPEKIAPVRHLLGRVRRSDDADKQKHHVANLLYTPASLGYAGKRCGQPEHCGWSLSYYGFAPCSSAAGIMRLQDLIGQYGKMDLPQVRGTEANWPKLQELCNQCYHALKPEHKIKSGTSDPDRNKPGEALRPHLDSWLAGKQHSWPAYGTQPQMVSESGVFALAEERGP